MFTKNVGSLDRTLRIIIGLVLLCLVFIGPQTAWGFVGLILCGYRFLSVCWC